MNMDARHGEGSERTLTFVVSTGRSGSTALSKVISMHPDLLSLNELYSSVPDAELLTDAPLSGAEFWEHLGSPNANTDRLLRSGVPIPEIIYDDGAPERRRYSAATTGIPALCLMVLPHLTDDPDAMLDELEPEVRSWPTRPAPRQWWALFDALADRFGKPRAVVERSGFSLNRVTRLRECFPEARFVHLFRDGADCALSMSRHGAFRLLPVLQEAAARCGLESALELTPEHAAQLPEDLAALLQGEFDPSLILDRDIPLAAFGALWSGMVVDGMERLAAVPADRLMSLSYEALLRDPAAELGRLAEFVGVAPRPEWLTEGGGLLHSASAGSARKLPPEDLAALREACAPGTNALRDVKV